MSVEENKALVHHYFEEIWDKGNLALIYEILAPNYVNHDPALAGLPQIEGFKQRVAMIRTPFPDMKYALEDMVTEGDRVATRWTARCTHKGEFMGIVPTGKQLTITGITPSRLEGGQYAEDWTLVDNMGIMQQLGVVSPPG
jgi:steroid delta-isomerase-like uncharacterized protein